MPGIWTDERRARAREIALQVKPWLKSTGPRTPEGKAVVARNRYRGGVRPAQRAARRECKAGLKAFVQAAAWGAMEARIDAWIAAQIKAGKPITAEAMRRAGLRELAPPGPLPAEEIAMLLRPLANEVDRQPRP